MKITFIIQDLFQQGAQYVTALMVRGFISKGYDVDLILSKVHEDLLEKGDIFPYETPKETNIIILGNRKASKNIYEIRKYLKYTNSAAIIAMSSNYTQALAIAGFGLRKKPLLAYVEHSGIIGLNRNTGELLPTPSCLSINRLKSRFIISQFDTIMAVSEGTAKSVERMNKLKQGSVHIVYNPTIDNLYYEKLSLDPKHPWLKDKIMPTFIAAGAHSAIKDHFMLFEAIKIVIKSKNVRLILFGKGDLTEQYHKWIVNNEMENYISLANHTSQLPAELKSSDGLLISSKMESFSLVLVEAMGANVPVISTNCPFGPSELLANSKFGTLVPIGDSNAMAQAILRQIETPKPAAPCEAWKRFTVENVVSAYENALNLQ